MKFADKTGGTNPMPDKVLIAYASRAGSTAEIATAIGETLAAHGAAVDVLPLKSVTSLAGYRAVVIGSAIRFGSWLPEAVKFVEQNRQALSQRPLAIFAAHILNTDDDETSRQNRQQYLAPVRKLVTPRAEALFAGVGDPKKVSFVERQLYKAVKAPQGDYRSWQAIRAWAESLQNILLA
jgi:menaquinone-dependent protoporphyrinogen oxidase